MPSAGATSPSMETWIIERAPDGNGWLLDPLHEHFESKRLAIEFAANRAAMLYLRIRESEIGDDRIVLEMELIS